MHLQVICQNCTIYAYSEKVWQQCALLQNYTDPFIRQTGYKGRYTNIGQTQNRIIDNWRFQSNITDLATNCTGIQELLRMHGHKDSHACNRYQTNDLVLISYLTLQRVILRTNQMHQSYVVICGAAAHAALHSAALTADNSLGAQQCCSCSLLFLYKAALHPIWANCIEECTDIQVFLENLCFLAELAVGVVNRDELGVCQLFVSRIPLWGSLCLA